MDTLVRRTQDTITGVGHRPTTINPEFNKAASSICLSRAYLAHTSLSARLTESMYSMIGWGRYIDPKEREQLLDGADENV